MDCNTTSFALGHLGLRSLFRLNIIRTPRGHRLKYPVVALSVENDSDWTVTVASAEVVSAEAWKELAPLLSAGVRLHTD